MGARGCELHWGEEAQLTPGFKILKYIAIQIQIQIQKQIDTNTDTNMKAQLTPSFKMLKQNSFEYLAIQIQI